MKYIKITEMMSISINLKKKKLILLIDVMN